MKKKDSRDSAQFSSSFVSAVKLLHLYLVILQTLLFKAIYNLGIHNNLGIRDSSWRGKQTEEMLVTLSLRHCSNKYELAREGEKEKEDFFYDEVIVSKEMSFQLLLEDWHGSSVPDRGGKIIPPARNDERECSGEWFWASLWWYHEASLTSRSQTSGGDVNS